MRRSLLILVVVLISGAALAQSQQPARNPVFVGAGDIAACSLPGDEATAKLLDTIVAETNATVFTLGDNVYPEGTAERFAACYEPSWGRFKARTRPTLGNHDYMIPWADPYFEYFGRRAGPPRDGYYSFNLGAWHIISLNSSVDARIKESAQGRWLRADLEKNRTTCTLVFWHHPVFASLKIEDRPRWRDVWRLLYEYGVDVVLVGDVHYYERFAPQDADGRADPRGIRQFIVGTGGATLANRVGRAAPNSEIRDNSTWGVLKLTLRPTSYDWEFIPVEGGTFRDVGGAPCVVPVGQMVM
jgi:acid phosphatase type 7